MAIYLVSLCRLPKLAQNREALELREGVVSVGGNSQGGNQNQPALLPAIGKSRALCHSSSEGKAADAVSPPVTSNKPLDVAGSTALAG